MTEDRTELGNRVRELRHIADLEEHENVALEVDGTVRYALRTSETAQNTAISVYPVGFMSEVLALRAALRRKAGASSVKTFVWRWHLRRFREQWRKRAYWNGFLAEVDYPPEGLTHNRCGRGWTRRAAARDLGYQLWIDNRK